MDYIKVIVNTTNERYLLNTPITTLVLFKFITFISPSTICHLYLQDDSSKLFEIALRPPLFEQVSRYFFTASDHTSNPGNQQTYPFINLLIY